MQKGLTVDSLNKLGNFILKYKLIHIAYWVYAANALAHILQSNFGGGWTYNLGFAIIITIFQMLCVYYVIYFLLPRYLHKQKYIQFILFTLLSIMTFTFLSGVSEEVYAVVVLNSDFVMPLSAARIIPRATDMTIVTAVFCAAVVIQSKYANDQLNKKLERERLEAELNFLRAQVNPHFLFNAINSIYVLIDENRKLASETLLKFSGLLRYQLYECRDVSMPIEKELNFLRDYIGLEVIRSRENLKVDVDISPDIRHFEIAPFILTPFVENAFKHVSHDPVKGNYIKISAGSENGSFFFSVSNSVGAHGSNGNDKGIGLQNVKRRLSLIYPGKHNLEIKNNGPVYSVNFTLDINENEMHYSR